MDNNNNRDYIKFMDRLESLTRETGFAIVGHSVRIQKMETDRNSCYVCNENFGRIQYLPTKEDQNKAKDLYNRRLFVFGMLGGTDIRMNNNNEITERKPLSIKFVPLGDLING